MLPPSPLKKALRYGVVVVMVLLGASAVAVGRWKAREHNRQSAALAQDNMTLPSQSQRLMPLADTLDAEQRDTLFRHHDLASLFQVHGQNGFFGPHEQRLEVAFSQVRRDAVAPGTYHVAGLLRVAGVVSSLTGTIELRQTRYFSGRDNEVYIATGPFHFQQHAANKQLRARLDGVAALDFGVASGEAYLFAEEGAVRPRTRQFAFEGSATDARTGQPQRVLWAYEFAPVGNAVLGDFDIGGRMATVNPKYRKYGWTEYFENDEWWAPSPKPSLNL